MEKNKNSLISMLKKLWSFIPKRKKRAFSLLFILIVVSSFLELISIGAFLPFVEVLVSPDGSKVFQFIQPYLQIYPFNEWDNLLVITVLFSSVVIVSGITRMAVLIVSTRLSFKTGSDLSTIIYNKTLYQPYITHVSRNSSEVIAGVLSKSKVMVSGIIIPIIQGINSILIILLLVVFITNLNPTIFLLTFTFFSLIYFLLSLFSRKKIEKLSRSIAEEQGKVLKSLTEGLNGIRDVILDGTQNFYYELYKNSDNKIRETSSSIYLLSGLPRYVIEIFGLLIMTIIAFIGVRLNSGVVSVLPMLGVVALGAQRLLPSLHTVYQSWVTIGSIKYTLRDTLVLLSQNEYLPRHSEKQIKFNEVIELKNIHFRYDSESEFVLKEINLTIKKGWKVGFIGTTGSGKSTLLDIVMGLLEPTSGSLHVDGRKIQIADSREWQNIIAHVPQHIFLSDSTVFENIAFGIPKDEIDKEKVILAAKKAQIHVHIETLPEGYNTSLGERGIRLSGGQRQRIGIARALYKNAQVLVFDEATSALDNDTEQAVMESINSLDDDLTILIIAHRLTTVKGCDVIFELSKGQIINVQYN